MTRVHTMISTTIAIVFATLIASCGAPATTTAPASSEKPTAAPVAAAPAATAAPAQASAGKQITVSTGWGAAEMQADMAAAVKEFTAKTGIDVKVSTGNVEEFKQSIRTYLASDTPPDVLGWNAGNRARFFIDKGLILPVTDVFKTPLANQFSPGFEKLAQGKDGQYYFVPTLTNWWGIYYRPSVFQKAGVQAPITTWNGLLDACDKFRAAGITPITIGTKAAWPAAGWFDYINMRTNGPEFHIKLTDGEVAYNSPEVKETFQHWRELLDHKCFIENAESLEWEDAAKPLANGEAAMYLMGSFITEAIPDDVEKDLDFFQFPKINDVPVGEDAPTDGYFASAKSTNPEGAKAFLAYIGSQGYQERAARELKRLAANKNVPLDVYVPAAQRGIKMIQSADFVTQFYDRDTTPEMAEKGMAAFIQFMNSPDDVDAILNALDQERQRIFATGS